MSISHSGSFGLVARTTVSGDSDHVFGISEMSVTSAAELVTYRTCEIGEIFDISTLSRCIECPTQYYSFSTNTDNSVKSCESCPVEARECHGNSIDLFPGTWRWGNRSTVIYTCPFTDMACAGGTAASTESCKEGYRGQLVVFAVNGIAATMMIPNAPSVAVWDQYKR